MSNDDEYTDYFTNKSLLPWEWETEFCGCTVPEYKNRISLEAAQASQNTYNERLSEISKHDYTDYKVKVPPIDNSHCSRCNKRARWQLLTCSRCHKLYDWKFKHHASQGSIWEPSVPKGWAYSKGLCWKCIISEDPANDSDVPPQFIDPPRQAVLGSLDEIKFDL